MSTVIEEVFARKIFNSRGEETIEVEVMTLDGYGRASAPAGASRGRAEVVPYPNGGVEEAIKKVENLISPELIGMEADEQEEIDLLLHKIDGTEHFKDLGGNTVYAVSLATAEAAASSYNVPLFQYLGGHLADELPHPLGNVLGGGRHTFGKTTDIQEFLILPIKPRSFTEAALANILIHKKVGSSLKKMDKTFTGGRGDEGAWAPTIANEDALSTLAKVCEEVADKYGYLCKVGVDMAASTLWKPKEKCYLYTRDKVKRNSEQQLNFVLDIVEKYDLVYVEDPFHEDDFENFAELTKKAKGCLICGDDLFATNSERLAHGAKMSAANAAIIKVNQVGTLTDTFKAIRIAEKAKYIPIVSHRSGETTDAHIAHLAVAVHCPIIKTGVIGGSRVAKINELLRIEKSLGNRAKMSSLSFEGNLCQRK
ncbi:MAG: phosphopyruvate hydratase [Candidatus Bathyarchaeota archaeon]|nr:phosphopyruvate hydratase [Candidatus Bathyarchaeota archaeon]MDH5733311.1 phosphopyruvate hydratase [Candidatus Bathyarchaeota archaeon]